MTDREPADEPDDGGAKRRRVVDRADYDPRFDPDAPILCEICGAEMRYTGNCKIACGNCGHLRDCSDP